MDLQPHEVSLLTELKSKGPKWKGPIQDGITQSLLNEWLQDPYSAYLSLILGLEPEKPEPPYTPDNTLYNLHWGDAFHVGLEYLIHTGDINIACKEMLTYYDKTSLLHHPELSPRSSLFHMLKQYNLNVPYESTKEWGTEIIFDTLTTPISLPCATHLPYRLRGKFDGLSSCREFLAEHKCKKYIDPISLMFEIKQDTQVNLYLGICGARKVYYDLIKIPDVQSPFSIPVRSGMSTKEFTEKLYYGHCGKYRGLPISKYTHEWIYQGVFEFMDEQIEHFWQTTLIPLFHRINEWYEYVTDEKFDPLNPECYGPIFYKHPLRTFMPSNTDAFKCKFHSFLTGQDELSDLTEKDSLFGELE